METYDSRLDGKFEAWLSRVPAEGLRWLQAKTANQWIMPWQARPFEDWDLRDLRATEDERRAAALLAGLVVRDHLREVWEPWYKARREEAELLAGALDGTLELPAAVAVRARRLAEALGTGDSDALSWRTRELLEANDGGRAYQLTLRRLVCLAGRALRKAGALEDAFAAFTVSTTAWFWWGAPGSVEDRLRVEPCRWRWGLPSQWGGVFVPTVNWLDWSAYDHVIGCGTTIRHETLDLLGVPDEKQHVFGVHRYAVYPPSGKLPRLTGRVAVVDDVSEGMTSQVLAYVYDADVIDVGGWVDTGATRLLPVCTILDDEVLKEVYRPRAGEVVF